MNKIVECVPNFSEGRNPETISRIIAAIQSVAHVFVLDHTMDADHHRSVITFAGEPEAVVEAAVRAADVAAELIDLNLHQGEHPRLGALDVLPFVPIKGVTMGECVSLARTAGERIANELQIPVYLYEHAATRPSRVNLADVRRGEFEGLRREIEVNPDRMPDFGEAQIHPTAGAVAVGARLPLIAYNINLNSNDLSIAKRIAKAVRGSSGGLQYVKALGLALKERNQVQVSMNLINHEATPIFRVFDLVCREAERFGVTIAGSEIIGLVPQAALEACADYYLRCENFSSAVVLENRLQAALATYEEEPPVDELVETETASPWVSTLPEELASGTFSPNGGSAVALSGALAAALGAMVCHLTTGKIKFIEHENEINALLAQLDQHRATLQDIVTEDAESQNRALDAVRRDHRDEADRLARLIAIEEATKALISLRMRVAETALEVLDILDELAEIGNPIAFAELATGAQLALATLRGASYQILSNLTAANDEEFATERRDELDDMLARAYDTADGIEAKFYQTYPR